MSVAGWLGLWALSGISSALITMLAVMIYDTAINYDVPPPAIGLAVLVSFVVPVIGLLMVVSVIVYGLVKLSKNLGRIARWLSSGFLYWKGRLPSSRIPRAKVVK